jgi:hypothetical protein
MKGFKMDETNEKEKALGLLRSLRLQKVEAITNYISDCFSGINHPLTDNQKEDLADFIEYKILK